LLAPKSLARVIAERMEAMRTTAELGFRREDRVARVFDWVLLLRNQCFEDARQFRLVFFG